MERFLPAEPNREKIGKEILERVARDQEMQQRDMQDEEVWDSSVDEQNTLAMKHIIATVGWPTISVFGAEVASAAWLLVQHADHDPVFQQQCSDLMKQLKDGEVKRIDIAYLEDRVCVNTGRGQLYGTQFGEVFDEKGVVVAYGPKPIEDEANIDARRAELGLESFAEYSHHITQKYYPDLNMDETPSR
jgi:hypothetical protein